MATAKKSTNKKLKNSFTYKGKVMRIRKHEYANNNTALQITDAHGSPYCMLTVNLDEILMPNSAYIDSNNVPADLIKAVEDAGYITKTGRTRQSGFCEYPLYDIKNELAFNL